jgi:hypothetical protein
MAGGEPPAILCYIGSAIDPLAGTSENGLRPILLTGAAVSLGMIPIASEVFWSRMAYAVIGGLFVATLLTLLFLPALYVAWFRIKEPRKEPEPRLGGVYPPPPSRAQRSYRAGG